MARASFLRLWFGVNGFMVGLLVAVVVAVGAAVVYWQGRSQMQAQAGETPTVYLRDEFAASVLGKSEDQVVEAVGKPDQTSEDAEAIYWHYRRRTRNPASSGTDSDAQVVFERGKVIAINY